MKRINLLPKPRQQELADEKILYAVTVAVIIATAMLLFGVLIQFGTRIYLDRQTGSINNQIDQLKRTANKTENAAVKQKIQLVNNQITDFERLEKQTPEWSRVMAAFLNDVPPEIKITQFSGDAAEKKITINGFSASRDSVIDLYNNINADKDHFKDINYPLENVAQPTNVKFNFSFTIVDSVLTDNNGKN